MGVITKEINKGHVQTQVEDVSREAQALIAIRFIFNQAVPLEHHRLSRVPG